ncbi:polar growth protein [Linnemannia elongata]|nr:polar growth protein [Linnemannia elongata]
MPETVWAIHNFEAEAEDEISFHIGEPIIVLQKDDLYQDGWWEGTNVRGETGLFPVNYTVRDPPEQNQPGSPIAEPNGFLNDSVKSGGNNSNSGNNSNNNNSNNNKYGGGNSQDNGHMNGYHNNNSNGQDHNRSMEQSSQSHLANSMNNMHIHQNPAIASPPPSGRNGFGSSSGASTPSGGAPNSKVIAQSVEESLNDPQLAGHPSTWSIDQVAYWLRWCGFGSIAPSFIDNEISGAILLELNLNNLKELEINSFGKRFNIMNAITSLKQATKGDQGGKGQYTGLANSVGAMFAGGAPGGPNIPPRMTSAVGGPSPRASTYDPRNDYMQDPRQETRGAPMSPPASVQSPSMRQQQPVHPSDYDMHSRNNALARSDTMGSISGGSTGEHNGRGGQRQSITSAYSSTSGPQRNQWERNAPRPPQMPSPAPHPMEQSMDQYPRPMDRVAPTSPEMYHQEQFSPEPQYQQVSPQQRKAHAPPDSTNRPMNGKADPGDKVVSLDNIGKPDYAGWLKKRGDTYRTWKSRWFMLKGVTLYYMNSPKDNASKDYINLVGYKIIQDENIYAGKYCFKAVHEELRNFYFYTESEQDMKGWLKALMKVTIGRDPSAPVISSSNIPTIPLHVARRMAPRPPSPSKRNRGMGPNGQPNQPQQQQRQQEYDPRQQQQQQNQRPQQQQQQQLQQQLDYDDQDSDGEGYLQNEYGDNHNNNYRPGPGGSNGMNGNHHNQGHEQESPVLQSLSPQHQQQQQQQQRRSFLQDDDNNGHDDPWRDEDDEGFGQQQAPQPRHQQQQHLKNMRPDSELDTFRQHSDDQQSAPRQSPGQRWTQEQYIDWMNRNLPDSAGPVSDMTQSLRSGVVLVRLIEQLSGEQVDKRIPNATYTLQMLENLLTAFKFMDRVGVSTDGYTVKDIFNGNEEKIVQMFESIRARFPHDAPQARPSQGQSNGMRQNGHIQPQHTGGSEYEALYEEAARSTIG